MIYLQSGNEARGGKNVGFALGGGGLLGLVYEIGVMHALEDALDGINLTDVRNYVGVSGGAWNAALLANGIGPAEARRILVDDASASIRMSPAKMVRWSVSDLFKLWKLIPQAYLKTVLRILRNPLHINLLEVLGELFHALPPAIFNTATAEKFMEELFTGFGITNDFRHLNRHLYIVATKLDTGEVVRFGSPGYDHVPISKAIQASQAVPGLFPPVEIDGEYYIDGGLKKSFHASSLFEAGADMIFCINPLVPYDARLVQTGDRKQPKSLVEGGWRAITAQGMLQMAHTRLRLGLEQYRTQYPDRELVLIEPDGGDETMFFSNVWNFEQRREICEHAYQGTMRDLREKEAELRPLLARYGISIRPDVLEGSIKDSASGNTVRKTGKKDGRRRLKKSAKPAVTPATVKDPGPSAG